MVVLILKQIYKHGIFSIQCHQGGSSVVQTQCTYGIKVFFFQYSRTKTCQPSPNGGPLATSGPREAVSDWTDEFIVLFYWTVVFVEILQSIYLPITQRPVTWFPGAQLSVRRRAYCKMFALARGTEKVKGSAWHSCYRSVTTNKLLVRLILLYVILNATIHFSYSSFKHKTSAGEG